MATSHISSAETLASPSYDVKSSNLSPSDAREEPPEDEMRSVEVPIRGIGYLQCLNHNGKPTLPSVLQACWALILNRYLGVDSIYLEYLELSQSRLVECDLESVSKYRCDIKIEENETLLSLLERTRGLFGHICDGEVDKTKDYAREVDSSILFREGKTGTSVRQILTTLQLNHHSPLLDAWSTQHHTELHIYYRPSKLPHPMGQNIAFTLGKLLSDINLNSAKSISSIDFLSQHDLDQIWEWNSRLPEPMSGSVHGLIAAHVHSNPDSPALCSWESTLSYRELGELSTRLASRLSSAGAHRGVIVPLLFEKSIWAVVTTVAVMRTGAAFVLLDVNQPDGRLNDIVTQVNSKLLVTSAEQEERGNNLGAFQNHVVVTRKSIGDLPNQPAFSPPPHAANDLLYVVFTSGSTGKPKGVKITHSNYLSGALRRAKIIGYDSHCRVFDFPSYSFDMSLECILGTLVTSGCVCVPSEDERLNDPVGAMRRLGVNAFYTTPTVARLLDPTQLDLRWVRLGGESLAPIDLQWAKQTKLFPSYGPAECAVVSTLNPRVLEDGNTRDIDSKNIGRGVNTVTWIVDPMDHKKLSPIGAVGELVIEGPTVGQGYLNDAAKTAASFIKPPLWLEWGAEKRRSGGQCGRLYKTGDLVRYAHDGSLIFVGRRDGQVKIHGQRVEIGDIEHHVRQCLLPGTPLAVEVVPDPHRQTEPMLVAFVVFLSDQRNNVNAKEAGRSLMSFCPSDEKVQETLDRLIYSHGKALEATLPRHMLPSLYIAVEQLPLTLSGKTDRKALKGSGYLIKELKSQRQARGREMVRPSSQKEEMLRGAWGAALKIAAKEISVADDFLSLGGDSLAAMKVVATARLEGFSLLVSEVFQYPTLTEAASRLSNIQQGSTHEVAAFSLLPDDPQLYMKAAMEALGLSSQSQIEDIYPCAPLQEGLMALSAKRPGEYITQTVIDLSEKPIDLHRFKAAWDMVYDSAGSILRAHIAQLQGLGFCHVIKRKKISWLDHHNLEETLERNRRAMMGAGASLATFASVLEGPKRYIVWTMHHAIIDGWARRLIEDFVVDVYHHKPALQYPPFSHFVKGLLEQDSQHQQNYWRAELSHAECEPYPYLPSRDFQPNSSESLEEYISLDNPTMGRITQTTVIKAAWALVVTAQTNCDGAIFGCISTGRGTDVHNMMNIIGPTLATIPTLIHTRKDESVYDFLQRVQRQSFDVIPFEHFGLQNIQRLGPRQQEMCRFQTLLVVQPQEELGEKAAQQDEIRRSMSSHETSHTFSTYAIQLEFIPRPGSFLLKAMFDPVAVHPRQMARLVDMFKNIAKQLCNAEPGLKVFDIDAIGPMSRKEIWTWNRDLPRQLHQCVHDLILRQANVTPSSQAVEAWDGRMTYAELDTYSHLLALHLNTLGVSQEMIVPLCFEKSIWTIVSMLAVLRAGGAFLLLDRSHPIDRLEFFLKKSKAQLLLVSPTTASMFTGRVAHIVTVTLGFLRVLQEKPKPKTLLRHVHSSSAAVTLFTSGSTGLPKGMIQSHATAATAAVTNVGAFGYNTSTRLLQFATYSFDMSIIDILTTLTAGGCVCVAAEQDLLNDLPGVIRAMNVNTLCMTPSVARNLDPAEIPLVERIVLGGEAIRTDLVDKWARKVVLINGYGPAEASVCVADVVDRDEPSVVGRAVGSATWILDQATGRLASIGATGELAIEGPLLARGYLEDASATQTRFLENPDFLISGTHGIQGRTGRVYMTGDLARYNVDGRIEICGRQDTQVKLRGQRIELGEVEHTLRQVLPNDTDVAVDIISPDQGRSEPMLVAFISGTFNILEDTGAFSQGLQSDIAEVEEKLHRSLPKFMVPSGYVVLPQLPLTPALKRDRKKLKEIGTTLSAQQLLSQAQAAAKERITLATSMELALGKAWATTLKLKETEIAANDNFFGLGGDSISAMRLVALLRKTGQALSVAEVFKFPYLMDMAKAVSEIPKAMEHKIPPFSLVKSVMPIPKLRALAASACQVADHEIQDMYQCTPLQQGLIALSAKTEGAYVARNVMVLPQHIDINRFKSAWQTVFTSSGILRTRIVQLRCQAELMQVVVHESIEWKQHEDLDTYLSADANAGMTLGGPLGRYCLVKDPTASSYTFVWTTHHAIYDGWSKPLILSRVAQVYKGASLEPVTEYKAFIQYLCEMDRTQITEYWNSQLEGSPRAVFPALPSVSYKPAADLTAEYSIQVSREERSTFTIATIIRAACALLISTLMGEEDVLFGVTVTGRGSPITDIERIEGPTFATVPVRVPVDKNMAASEFLSALQSQSATMMSYEQIGLQNIRRLSSSAKNACDFQTLLVIQPEEDRNTGDWLFGPNSKTAGVSTNTTAQFNSYALMLVFSIAGETVKAKASFDSKVLPAEQVERLLRQLDWTVQRFLPEPKESLGAISSASPQDLEDIWRWNKEEALSYDANVQNLFYKQASRHKRSVAVDSWDGILTYEELDVLSSEVELHLREMGVIPGDKICLCFEKSKWVAIGSLGVVKLGAAFVLLDDGQPQARLRSIVRQVQPKMLLASQNNKDKATDLIDDRFVTVLSNEFMSHSSRRQSGSSTREQIPLPPISSELPLYIVYTSGSTGEPKGIVISHRNYLSGAVHRMRLLDLTMKEARILDFAPYSFDVSIENMFLALLSGGCLCIPSPEARLNDLESAMAKMEINTAHLTPSVARLLRPGKLPKLRLLRLGGEAMTATDIERWQGHVKLVNSYGPSECAVTCVMNLDVEADPFNIGCGRAANTWIVDANDHNKLLPIGAVGELLIEGPTVARGYLHDPTKTDQVFLDITEWLGTGTANVPGRHGRLYKTGDLVRYRHDGSIIFLGRKDTQVKLRGQRLELGEIEHHLRRMMGSSAVAVELVFSETAEPSLVAFFVIVKGHHTDRQSVIDQWAKEAHKKLQDILPRYMLPSAYRALESLPLSRSGKVDRKKLREIGAKIGTQTKHGLSERLPTETERQRLLQDLWASALKVDPGYIGRDSNFFTLGGDSISAMRLVAAARDKNLSLSILDVFENPSLESMSSVLNDAQPTSNEQSGNARFPFSKLTDVAAIENIYSHNLSDPSWTIEQVLPVTDYQSWTVERSVTKPRDQLLYEIVHLDLSVEIGRLKQSCRHLCTRHEILRTVFHKDNDCYRAIVLKDTIVRIDEYQAEGNLDEFAKSVCQNDAESDDISLGRSLARFMLVRHPSGSRCFIFRISHAQYDAIGLWELLQDLRAIYDSAALTTPPRFSPYVYMTQEISQRPATYDYWRSLLQGATMTRLFPQPSNERTIEPAVELRRVIALAPLPQDITLSSIVTAAWALTLAQLTSHSSNVMFGRLVSGRNVELDGVAKIVGPCINVAPIRLQIRQDATVLQLLRSVQRQGLESTPFEVINFQQLVERCTEWEMTDGFDSVVQHQNVESVDALTFGGKSARVESYIPHQQLAKRWWLITVPTGSGGLLVKLSARKSMREKASTVAAVFCSLMEQMGDDWERSVASLGV